MPHLPAVSRSASARAALTIAVVSALWGGGLALASPPVGGGCTPGRHTADGQDCHWTGTAPPIAGLGVYSRGEYIYTDFAHDDSGANVDGLHSNDADPGNPVTGDEYPNPSNPTSPRNGSTDNNNYGRLRHSGDFGYPSASPTAPFDYNDTADLLEFRTAVDHGQLHYRVTLGSLVHPTDTVVAVGIDADRNVKTGSASLPHGANLSEPVGLDYVVTMWGSGGDLTDYTGPIPKITPIKVAANLTSRTIEADVPIPAHAHLGSWRTYLATGLWDATSKAWARPTPSVPQGFPPGALLTTPFIYDLGFTAPTANDEWRDTTQADDLAASDLQRDHADIDMKLLAAGGSAPVSKPTGLIGYTYRTLPLGSGQGEYKDPTGLTLGSIDYVYQAATQGGAMMLPTSTWTDPHARRFMYFFHCLNCNQNIWENGVEDAATPGRQHVHDGPLGTDHVQSIVDRNDMLVGGSLQRGEAGAGSYGWSAEERDLLDNWKAMHSSVGTTMDPNKVMFAGMSMGAGTTEKMMTLYPDSIATAVAYSGASSISRLENLRNVPFFQLNGDTGLDSTAPVARQTAQTLDGMGYQHMYVEYLGRAHDFNLVFESQPLIEPTAWRTVRDPNPARVTYTLDPALENPKLGLVHDHAYWASALRVATGSTSGTIDATALPLAGKLPKQQSVLTGDFANSLTGNNVYVDWLVNDQPLNPASLAAVQPGWQALPDVSVTTTKLSAPSGAGTNAFTLRLTGLCAATLDASRMGLNTTRTIRADVNSDHPASVTLQRAGAGAVRVNGNPVPARRHGASLTVDVPAGHTILTVG